MGLMITGGGNTGGFASTLRADAELALAHWVLKSYARRAGTAGRGTATSQDPYPLAAISPPAPRERGPRSRPMGEERSMRSHCQAGGGDSS
jgi:hypothetical protein